MRFQMRTLLHALVAVASNAYDIGVGISDITGPAAQVTFMGYAVGSQKGEGIHFRQRARAFVVSDGDKKIAYVSGDFGMGADMLNKYVVEELDKRLGKGVYTMENICISGTHTHSTPGGYAQYVMVQVPSLGYIPETFQALVTGCADAIAKAHENLQPGKIKYSRGALVGSNINRSPSSYLLNPQSERDEYASIGDTDKDMLMLRFESADGTPVGMLNWFAVHGTSMNSTNRLISGDNRGLASMRVEALMNGPEALPGFGKFVAAFASTNLGDVSPNIAGPKCLDTGLPCDLPTSTCNGRTEQCIAFGPGTNGDHFESTDKIAQMQVDKAMELFNAATEEVTGPIDFRQSWVSMDGLPITLENGTVVYGCSAALGESFAAGTTDGPGQFDFTQGSTSPNPFWAAVSSILSKPTRQQKDCHHPKPILLNLANINIPYAWEAPSMPVQVFRIGNVVTANTPNELTTMSGRRLRKVLTKIWAASDIPADKLQVTIGGLANSYSHYVATFEEYQAQRYEAASTMFGPHTLSGYIQEFSRLSNDMLAGRESATAEIPTDLTSKQLTLQTGVVFDDKPLWREFGEVLTDVDDTYAVGATVRAEFQGANPRNNLRLQGTFMTVERQDGSDWNVVATDSNWETKFRWKSTNKPIASTSKVTLEWTVPSAATAGIYKLCYLGDWKSGWDGKITEFKGCSSTFSVGSAVKYQIV